MLHKIFSWFENRIDPYPDTVSTNPRKGVLPFVWTSLEGMRKWILILMIFSIGTAIFEAMLFQFMGVIVQWLSQYGPGHLWQAKGHLLIGIACVLLFYIVWSFVGSNVHLQVLQGVFPMRLRWNFHRLMLGQSMGFYQDEFAGRVSAKVMQTALAVRDVVTSVADLLVFAAVYFVTASVILIGLDAYLILPFAVWLVVFFIVLRCVIPRLSKLSQAQADARSLMTGRVTDAYTNIATVKLFSHSAREIDYAKTSMQEFMKTVVAQMRLVTVLETVIQTVNMSLIILTAAFSIWVWNNGWVGVGAVATAIAMAVRLNGLSHRIMWESARLFENIGTVQDGMMTLSKPHTVVDKPNALPLVVTKGDIQFKDVTFAYAGKAPLLEHFNLHIRSGEKVGLVGRSGAGKSSLTNLLLRFYDIQGGEILIDDQNIALVTQESLRQQIGLVTQDTSLLHRSVRENILYGRPQATEEEMLKAADQAAASSFIPQLSDAKGRTGYDAYVGERGVKLSGGQRQRIAIARVMLKDAPILILDEATSALDSEVEVAIQENLTKLMQGKTVIAIAHRLSTIAAMDRLIVMDKGRIIEQGHHDELLAKQGVYAKLWAHQSGGFLPEFLD